MTDKELDCILREALSEGEDKPAYLDTRLRGELEQARGRSKALSVWWLPLALSLAMGVALMALGGLLPWPLNVLVTLSVLLTVGVVAAFTLVGLLCFDLRRKGRVFLC